MPENRSNPDSRVIVVDYVRFHGHAPLSQMKDHPELFASLMDFAETGSMDGIPERIAVKPDLGHNKELPRIDPATLSN